MYNQYPPPNPYGPPGFGPPGFGYPYPVSSPIAGVKTGATLIGSALVGLLAIALISTGADWLHIGGYSIHQGLFWLRMCALIVLLVGLAMMARLPRVFGVQMSAWGGFGVFLLAFLFTMAQHLAPYSMFSGSSKVSWFIHTLGYAALPPLVMITAQTTGIRFGAATNAIVGSLVGIWRFGMLFLMLRTMDDPYGYGPSYGGGYGGGSGGMVGLFGYGSPQTEVRETLLMLPALGALAALFFLLREMPEQPMFGPGAPPLAPYPGGYAPPAPPYGGYGPPGPPPPY